MGGYAFGRNEAGCLGGRVDGMAEAFAVLLVLNIGVSEEGVVMYWDEEVENRVGVRWGCVGRAVSKVRFAFVGVCGVVGVAVLACTCADFRGVNGEIVLWV